MNDKELNLFLIQQNKDQARQIESLTSTVESLTAEITELKKVLLKKEACTEKMVSKLNNLVKVTLPKKVEKRKVESQSVKTAPTPKERGNNGAKRK